MARTTALLQHMIVAGYFPFQRQFSRDPPYSGVEKEKSANGLLSEVGPIVAAGDMRQFVAEDRLDRIGADLLREQDNRPAKTKENR